MVDSSNETPPTPRGPKPLVTRELLLTAGHQAVEESQRKRAQTTTEVSSVLGVQLADVLRVCGDLLAATRRPPRPVAPPVLYKHWENFEDFSKDLVPEMFSPKGFDLSHLEAKIPWRAAIKRHALADKEQMFKHHAGMYFALFHQANDARIQDALTNVYKSYDDQVVPALAKIIERAGRQPKSSLGPNGIQAIATALTALSEGLMLRTIATPEKTREDTLWEETAVALVEGMTEENYQNDPTNRF